MLSMEKLKNRIWFGWQVIKLKFNYYYKDLTCYHEYKHVYNHIDKDGIFKSHALYRCVTCDKCLAIVLAKENNEPAEL